MYFLARLIVVMLTLGLSNLAIAALTIKPVTWDVIGLDSNKPVDQGPDLFPVGARVCNTGASPETLLAAQFVKTDTSGRNTSYITAPADGARLPLGKIASIGDTTGTIAAGECADVYFNAEIDRNKLAYSDLSNPASRLGYKIFVVQNGALTAVATPANRELYVEYLVSQNRNAVDSYVYDGTPVANNGGSVNVAVGQTFTLQINAHTAPGGYEQLETFMTLPSNLFRINSITRTYEASAGTDADAPRSLYADGCTWQDDYTQTATYHNNNTCLGVGKYGGNMALIYNITVIGSPDGLGGGSYTGNTVIYDFSGSSYHYNSDYANTLGFNWSAEAPAPTKQDVGVEKAYLTGSGNSRTFRLKVTNYSNAAVSNVTVTDHVLDGYSVDGNQTTPTNGSITSPSPWPPGGQTSGPVDITWSGINLGASQSTTFDIVLNQKNIGNFLNCAVLTFANDLDASNNSSCAAPPDDEADIAVSKTVFRSNPAQANDTDTTIEIGNTVTFTVTAKNLGPAVATGVVLTDVIPAAGYSAITPGTPTLGSYDAGTGDWTIGDLAVNSSATLTFTAVVSDTALSNYVNTATLKSSTTRDPNPGNDRATATVVPTYLTIEKAPDSATWKLASGTGVVGFAIGGTFTIQVKKSGNNAALTNVVVDDVLPSGLVLASTPAGINWTCTGVAGAQTFRCVYQEASTFLGDYPTISVPVHFDNNAAQAPVSLTNFSSVRSAVDPNSTSESIKNYDEDTGSVTIQLPDAPSADLSITKTDGVTTVTPGGSVMYTIVASNAGPSNVTGATVSDTLPASLTGATWTCVGAGGGTCTASGSGNISGTVNLPVGGSVTYTVTATVSASASGSLSNTATVSAPGGVTDPTPGNNSATDTATVSTVVPSTPAPIPTLSEWGQIIMALLLAALGFFQMAGGRINLRRLPQGKRTQRI